jgi:hypothetical protein
MNGRYERLLERETEGDDMNIFQPKINRISDSDGSFDMVVTFEKHHEMNLK